MNKHTLIILAMLAAAPGIKPALHGAENETLPTVTVTASGAIGEDARVGPYNQPEWTEHRRFTTTRVYIQQEPWEAGFEQWWRARTYKKGSAAHRFIEELEIGLPGRLQFDFYYNWTHQDGRTRYDETAVELRWALADWGKIWGNPTLYLEYAFVNHDFGGDTLESKILFGDDFGRRWHWGLNFIFETELSHERAKQASISGGLSYTLIDQVLGAGVEWQWKHETVAGDRGNPEVQFEVGPSVQWRMSRSTHLDLVALFGTTKDGPRVDSFVVFGWDFGGGKSAGRYAPVTGQRN